MGFPTKKWSFWGVWGIPLFKETPMCVSAISDFKNTDPFFKPSRWSSDRQRKSSAFARRDVKPNSKKSWSWQLVEIFPDRNANRKNGTWRTCGLSCFFQHRSPPCKAEESLASIKNEAFQGCVRNQAQQFRGLWPLWHRSPKHLESHLSTACLRSVWQRILL